MNNSENRNWFSRTIGSFFSKRVLPYWCILLLDAFIVFFSCVFCYWVENRSVVLIHHRDSVIYTSLFYALLSWIGAKLFRTYSGVVRYSSLVDLMKVALANLVTLALAMISYFVLRWQDVTILSALSPIAIVASIVVATALMWAMRLLVRTVYEQTQVQSKKTRVLIYGALTGGVGVAKNIRSQKPAQYELCGFISHEHRIRNMSLMGVDVFNPEEDLAAIVKKLRIEAVLVSPLRVDDFRNNQHIQDVLIGAGCKILMAQLEKEASVIDGELEEGAENDMQLKEVSVEDLLPRQQIKVDMKSVEAQLTGKRVLITGSAGSIGAEIVRQVASYHPAEMMLIDQAETPQHDIRLMMANEFPDVKCQVVVTSISRRTRMESVFRTFRPDYVFHAAAYKHVPMMENNPSEAVMNNIYGTKVIADMSVQYGAKKFVMISTDKAVNPTNVMGCSKRICEIYVQSLDRKLKLEALEEQHKTGNKVEYTQFVTTRFGNVLGSNGSVIPLFREQIKKGGPVTVTDERIVRFFMLIPEACKLVLEAGTKG
ncbi:MAG: polysaccharide biosynthesis protein, partial [Bacteroidales bacterium]|nr:polysaccharide biosynthesis protein [Bacteroidales bacterium]